MTHLHRRLANCVVCIDKDRVTILIKQWRGIEQKARFRLYMKHSRAPYPNPSWIPLPHSKSVNDSSIELLSSKLPSPHMKFIGVHLRSEKVMSETIIKLSTTNALKFYYLALYFLYGLLFSTLETLLLMVFWQNFKAQIELLL